MVVKLNVIDVLVGVLNWMVLCLLYIRDELKPAPMPEVEHQGGESILPGIGSLKLQPSLVMALGKNEKKALIIQKIHEWCVYNQKNSSHLYDDKTWTYGSHPDWHKRHFSWFTTSYLGKLLKELVDDGFLFATDQAPFCKKNEFAYRVNYLKISAAVDWKEVQHPTAISAVPPRTKCGEGLHKVRDNNSKTKEQIKKINQSKQTTTANARVPESIGRVWADDGVGVDSPDHDSGEYVGLGESLSDDTAQMEPIRDEIKTPPGSAAPPSFHDALIRQMFDLFEIYPDAANRLISDHTAKRCQAVINYVIVKRPKMDSPSGWYVSELQNNWRGIPDDFSCKPTQSNNRYQTGEWADIIKS